MASFLYISEVFCPWCYGFSPVMQRLAKEYLLGVNVLCGALNDEPVSLALRAKRMPNITQFIERMFSMTGVRISTAYLNMLFGNDNHHIFMDSQKSGLLFYGMKHFMPSNSLQILEDLQHIVYEQGQDLFSEQSLGQICQKYAVNTCELIAFMEQAEKESHDEIEESFTILGDIVLYPTLFYIDDDDKKHLISRGFTPYDEVKQKIDECINCVSHKDIIFTGLSCGLDGVCINPIDECVKNSEHIGNIEKVKK